MAADACWFVGLDVGGQSMKAAVIREDGHVYPSVVLPTEAHLGQEVGLETMCQTIRRAITAAGLTLDQITAIGVATPGLMDLKAGLITEPPNLKPWKNVPVLQHIRQTFDKPTAFQNDANAAAYGELWLGAGRGQAYESLCLFTLGTGIGGGIILADRILEGHHSHGAELGHMRIAMPGEGRLCGCGRRGCLEAYASAKAIAQRTKEALAEYRHPSRLRELLRDADGREITEKDVVHIFEHARQADPLAQTIVDDTAYYLALGACNVIATVDPQVILFGGGIISTGEWFLAKIEEYVRRFALTLPGQQVILRYATLGPDAGFIGAAGCARQLHLQSRSTSIAA